jgi:hypothetical protein
VYMQGGQTSVTTTVAATAVACTTVAGAASARRKRLGAYSVFRDQYVSRLSYGRILLWTYRKLAKRLVREILGSMLWGVCLP